MSALSLSTNSSYISAALAQQKVLGDQAQVQNDQALLSQDQAQLGRDSVRSTAEQQQALKIQQNQGQQARQAGLDQLAQKAQATQPTQPAPVSAPVQSSPATVNASGQTVGTIINIVA